MPRLGITGRCEDDLEALPTAAAERLLRKFEEARSEAPECGDLIDGLQARECHSLHSGRYRAVTWYDHAGDVVWLLAAGLHRSGSREDLYQRAIALERAGRLYPTPEDERRLEEDLAAEARRDRAVREALALRNLREQVLAASSARRHVYESEAGLWVEMWAAERIPELAVVRVRIRLRRDGEWIGDAALATLLSGVFDGTPIPVPDPDGDDAHFRCFEGYVLLPPT